MRKSESPIAMLELKTVPALRALAVGMPRLSTARKDDIIEWLRLHRPDVEGLPCDDFKSGSIYMDICFNCGLHLSQHLEGE